MPGPPDLAGKPRMMAQKMRPQMENGEPCCSLWESKAKADVIPAVRPGGVVLR